MRALVLLVLAEVGELRAAVAAPHAAQAETGGTAIIGGHPSKLTICLCRDGGQNNLFNIKECRYLLETDRQFYPLEDCSQITVPWRRPAQWTEL